MQSKRRDFLWTQTRQAVMSEEKVGVTSRGRPSPHLSGSRHSTCPEGCSLKNLSWGHWGRSCSAALCCTAQNLPLNRRKPKYFNNMNRETFTCVSLTNRQSCDIKRYMCRCMHGCIKTGLLFYLRRMTSTYHSVFILSCSWYLFL